MTLPTRPARGAGFATRERMARAVLLLVVAILAFLLGIAFAQTLDERPEPGGVVTNVRTLTPLPQRGPERTVTVTVTTG